MENVLEGLQPANVYKYFSEISAIPRQSRNCKAISDYCVSFAKAHNLDYYQDEYYNVVIYKPAKGDNSKEPVILQGHLDMVCEKNYEYDSKFDFSKDGLRLDVMDDYIYAKGTTLGADDGIAIAYILSILEADDDKYPPIEALFTVDEEVGMTGALSFDVTKLNGKRLINLDHEVEGELLTCSAGGRKVKCSFPVTYHEETGCRMNVTVCGLVGGHSGTEIDKGRGNANIILGRVLHYINRNVDFLLSYLGGGLIDSAIPREAKAEIIVPCECVEEVENIVTEFGRLIIREFEGVEDNMMIYTENLGEEKAKVVDTDSKKRIEFLLNTVPDGVIKMSRKAEGLVKTSLNCGIMNLTDDAFTLIINLRSMSESEKQFLSDKVQYLIENIGGTYTTEFDYPVWEYNDVSNIRETTFEAFQRVYGRNPKLKGFHAGLECGVFYNKIKDMDIVAFGPNIYDIHTPKERLQISSVSRVYELLCEVLKEC